MKRRAPEGGYIGGVKNQYRRNVWASFREAARRQGWSRSFCDVLLMPSAEGKEIEVQGSGETGCTLSTRIRRSWLTCRVGIQAS
jgi:hypothetical protein